MMLSFQMKQTLDKNITEAETFHGVYISNNSLCKMHETGLWKKEIVLLNNI